MAEVDGGEGGAEWRVQRSGEANQRLEQALPLDCQPPPRWPGSTRPPSRPFLLPTGGFVYIMANKRHGTIYTGVTPNLPARVLQHKNEAAEGFTKRYHLHTLVWFEVHETIESAIQREHNMGHWRREWKTVLVDAMNPARDDLYPTLF